MMRVLLDKLEEYMKGTVVDGVVKDLFCGKVRSYIRCINVAYESKREEDFYDIQLGIFFFFFLFYSFLFFHKLINPIYRYRCKRM